MYQPQYDREIDRWFARGSTSGARSRLYCFPYAGGSINTFLSWQQSLGESTEVCAAQLPGRGGRFLEPPCTSFDELVSTLGRLIAQDANLPFVLYGHSLGALVAFEVARYLRTHDLPMPESLIVSGCEAPHIRSAPKKYEEYSDNDLIQSLGELNGTPPEVLNNAELMQMLLPVIRADFALFSHYQFHRGAVLDIPITVLNGTEDDHIEKENVNDWVSLTRGLCNVQWLEGDHFFIDQSQPALLECLVSRLT